MIITAAANWTGARNRRFALDGNLGIFTAVKQWMMIGSAITNSAFDTNLFGANICCVVTAETMIANSVDGDKSTSIRHMSPQKRWTLR